MNGSQLELFSWDVNEISKAYKALSSLDFEIAKSAFSKVLKQIPDNSSAIHGMQLVADWQEIFQVEETLEREAWIVFLWKKIRTYDFGVDPKSLHLRQKLIEQLIVAIDNNPLHYIPPDLCLGYLLIETERYIEAEGALRTLLIDHPNNARLLGYLGDSLWMQGRKDEARVVYAKALLTAPNEVSIDDIRDKRLAEMVQESGCYMALIRGWMEGILPLVDIEGKFDKWSADNQALRKREGLSAYILLNEAEKARRNADHEKMVSYRKELKVEAPEVFRLYMEHLEQSANDRN
jgi:tetratricopeptide (TPR) repeat protein